MTVKNVLILHGAGNNSQGNWFPWLKNELENKGDKAWSPDLPNTDSPVQKEWIDAIFSNKDWEFNNESIMIGHSAGGTLILRILERLPKGITINKAIFVATPIHKGKFPEFFKYKEDLTREPFDWKKIRKSCKNFYFIASDNDPYDCGDRHAKVMHEKLGGEFIINPGEGHFNLEVSPSYKQFPQMLELIK